jgi:hypothetical protein
LDRGGVGVKRLQIVYTIVGVLVVLSMLLMMLHP